MKKVLPFASCALSFAAVMGCSRSPIDSDLVQSSDIVHSHSIRVDANAQEKTSYMSRLTNKSVLGRSIHLEGGAELTVDGNKLRYQDLAAVDNLVWVAPLLVPVLKAGGPYYSYSARDIVQPGSKHVFVFRDDKGQQQTFEVEAPQPVALQDVSAGTKYSRKARPEFKVAAPNPNENDELKCILISKAPRPESTNTTTQPTAGQETQPIEQSIIMGDVFNGKCSFSISEMSIFRLGEAEISVERSHRQETSNSRIFLSSHYKSLKIPVVIIE